MIAKMTRASHGTYFVRKVAADEAEQPLQKKLNFPGHAETSEREPGHKHLLAARRSQLGLRIVLVVKAQAEAVI